ncbi:MAG: sulfate ABC transporter substrate-binding protein [Bauldia sp.]
MTRRGLLALTAGVFLATVPTYAQTPNTILNVSYDVARELFEEINAAFIPAYAAQTGTTLTVNQSHGGSSAQARAVLDGLAADVVTLNQVTDITALVNGGLVSADWATQFPSDASPYYSLPTFLVRKGNPKNILDWGDLVREDVEVIFPNPKTSGNGRYTYLAATAWALEEFNGDQAQVQAFITALFDNVPVFDTGGRAATTTFIERELGDVLITFEAETYGIQREFGADAYDTVVPSISLTANFPVAIVNPVVDRNGSRQIATDYLNFLYTPEGQTILAENGYRPTDPTVAETFAANFPEVRLVTIEDVFGGWEQIQTDHFAPGALLDQLYGNR